MVAATQSQIVRASSAQVSTILGAVAGQTAHLTWRLINDADGTVMVAESSIGIVEIDDGRDGSRYDRAYTAPAVAGRYLAIWRHYQDEIAQSIVVAASADAAFATSDDVAARLNRQLTTGETENVPFLLNMAAAVIADAAGYDDGWAVTLNPVPNMLRMVSVELVFRALHNPGGYTQIRQQAGSYSFQASWDTVGMTLSDAEVMMVRRAVHGRTSDSAHVDSSFVRAQDEYWLRKQAVRASGSDQSDVIA